MKIEVRVKVERNTSEPESVGTSACRVPYWFGRGKPTSLLMTRHRFQKHPIHHHIHHCQRNADTRKLPRCDCLLRLLLSILNDEDIARCAKDEQVAPNRAAGGERHHLPNLEMGVPYLAGCDQNKNGKKRDERDIPANE